jgi:hypothetical protein
VGEVKQKTKNTTKQYLKKIHGGLHLYASTASIASRTDLSLIKPRVQRAGKCKLAALRAISLVA